MTRALLAGALGLLLAAPPADAMVPSAARVREEIARTNVQAGRARPLVIEIAVRDEAGAVAATGRASFDPSGLARLDLVHADGRQETHQRSPAGYEAFRDGARVERPLPLLPPLGLLQARDEAEVAAALVRLGGDPDRVDLGMAGGADCWVLGGRDPGPFDQNGRPGYWFDLESRRPVRIDADQGVRFWFGPPAKHGAGVFFPAWYLVEAPGWPRWRVEVQAAGPAAAP